MQLHQPQQQSAQADGAADQADADQELGQRIAHGMAPAEGQEVEQQIAAAHDQAQAGHRQAEEQGGQDAETAAG